MTAAPSRPAAPLAPFDRVPFDLVLFDMDDVLARYDPERRIAALARATGRPAAAIRAAIWESDYFALADSGAWDAAGCLAEFSARIGAPVGKARLAAKVFPQESAVGPDAIEQVLHRLRRKLAGSDVHIVTVRGLGYMLEPTQNLLSGPVAP